MHFLNPPQVLSHLDIAPVEFTPERQRCPLRAGELGQRAKVNPPDAAYDEDEERDKRPVKEPNHIRVHVN